MNNASNAISLTCPKPQTNQQKVLMAHGSGGRLMTRLIDAVFRPAFDNPDLQTTHDGALLKIPQEKLVMTTDSFVIRPLFFPGGDIGSLAVNGTVNDLAMCGARPLYLSVAFILEEGLAIESLQRIVASMRKAADAAGVRIVTGDTKVVERGHGDGLYINTTGIGVLEHGHIIAPTKVCSGDAVLISGDIGRHGMAVMAEREHLAFASPIESDCAPLVGTAMDLLAENVEVHCLRDVTRGGLAAVLNEIAEASSLQIGCEECAIPIEDTVRSACEILGLDPLHIASEGCFVAFVADQDAEKALSILQRHQPNAAHIGAVTQGKAGMVTLKTPIGGKRILDMPSGELLPRIC